MRATTALLPALLLIGCQSIDRPSISFDQEACTALKDWARQGVEQERIANWNWDFPEDDIPMRARMDTCSDTLCEPDEYDYALYEGLSRYTHSLGLGEFVWSAAICLETPVDLDMGEFGFVDGARSVAEVGNATLEISFDRDQCRFGDWDGNTGSSGCASFRTSATRGNS